MAFNFNKFAADHHIPILSGGHHHCKEGWLQTHCMCCSSGQEGWHLGFNLLMGYFNCWRCGRIRIVDAIKAWCHISTDKAWAIRWEYDDKEHRRTRKAPRVRGGEVPKPLDMEPLSPKHLSYLRNQRGILRPKALAKEWELKGTSQASGKWSWRVVSPIYNEEHKLVAYVGRSIIQADPKYRMTEDKDCGDDPDGLLYGIHQVEGDSIIVVEGPGDVWKIGPGAVATFGIDWRKQQANKLRRFRHRSIMFDPEPLAQKRAHLLAEYLSMFPGETEVVDGLPSDPGSLDYETVRKIRRELLGG